MARLIMCEPQATATFGTVSHQAPELLSEGLLSPAAGKAPAAEPLLLLLLQTAVPAGGWLG